MIWAWSMFLPGLFGTIFAIWFMIRYEDGYVIAPILGFPLACLFLGGFPLAVELWKIINVN